MNVPFEGELTATEQRVYDLVADPEYVAPTPTGLAASLRLDKPVVMAVLDGLEAMGFVRRFAGLWLPSYEE